MHWGQKLNGNFNRNTLVFLSLHSHGKMSCCLKHQSSRPIFFFWNFSTLCQSWKINSMSLLCYSCKEIQLDNIWFEYFHNPNYRPSRHIQRNRVLLYVTTGWQCNETNFKVRSYKLENGIRNSIRSLVAIFKWPQRHEFIKWVYFLPFIPPFQYNTYHTPPCIPSPTVPSDSILFR